MKKSIRMKSLSLLICTLLFLQYSTTIKAAGNTSQESRIKAVTTKYFDNQLKSIKEQKPENNEVLVNNESLKSYSKSENEFFNLWYKKLGISLLRYKMDLNFSNFRFINENMCAVDVTKSVEMVFDVAPDKTQKCIDKYSIELVCKNNKWYIEYIRNKDEAPDSAIQMQEYSTSIKSRILSSYKDCTKLLEERSNDINYKIKNIDNLVKEYCETKKAMVASPVNKSSVGPQYIIDPGTGGSFAYDKTAAVQYARTWAYGFNPEYTSFPSDCANFVSQCLHAGGIPMTSRWYHDAINHYTYSWTSVVSLYDYLLENGIGRAESNTNYVTAGDVLQFMNFNSVWSHSALVNGKDGGGNIYYAAHTSPRYDYGLYMVYPGGYKAVRFVAITY